MTKAGEKIWPRHNMGVSEDDGHFVERMRKRPTDKQARRVGVAAVLAQRKVVSTAAYLMDDADNVSHAAYDDTTTEGQCAILLIENGGRRTSISKTAPWVTNRKPKCSAGRAGLTTHLQRQK